MFETTSWQHVERFAPEITLLSCRGTFSPAKQKISMGHGIKKGRPPFFSDFFSTRHQNASVLYRLQQWTGIGLTLYLNIVGNESP